MIKGRTINKLTIKEAKTNLKCNKNTLKTLKCIYNKLCIEMHFKGINSGLNKIKRHRKDWTMIYLYSEAGTSKLI